MCSALLVLSVALWAPGSTVAPSTDPVSRPSPPGPQLRLGIGLRARWSLRDQLRLGSVRSALSRPPGWGLGSALEASYGAATGPWLRARAAHSKRRYRITLTGASLPSLTVRTWQVGAWFGYGVSLSRDLSLRPGAGLRLHQRRLPPAPGVLIQQLRELWGAVGATLDWRPGPWELRLGGAFGQALGIWERRPTSGSSPKAWRAEADAQALRWVIAHLGLALALHLEHRLIRFEGVPSRPLPLPEVGSAGLSQRQIALTAGLRLVYRP